jgi:hypothetical protein
MSYEHGFHSQQHTAGHEIAPVMFHADSQQIMGGLALLGVERFQQHNKSYRIVSKEDVQPEPATEEDLYLSMHALPETD